MAERLFVDKLAEIISRFEGGQTNGAPLADAIVDSGLIFELEEAAAKTAWAEGYLARTLDGDEFLKTPNPHNI